MGTCLSSSSSTSTHQDPNLAPGARPSKRWKWGHSERGLGKGLFDRWVDPEKGHSRRGGPTEEDLQSIRGRMAVNGASGVACLFTQQGRKGPNQDAMVVWENFASREDTVFCGVFDGHGPYGHMVAKKVRDSLPVKVCNQWKTTSDGHSISSQNVGGSANYEENASLAAEEEWLESIENKDLEKFPEVYRTLRQSLLKAFRLMDKELKLHPAIDCFCSGSTAVTLIKQGRDLIIGNLGDSRAVLGTRDKNGALVALQLTVDLKPNLPREAARIQQCKGRVFALQDEPDVSRVWLPNSDSPGLAMARAFGDFCLKDYGLISVPDIRFRHLTDQDEFIVLATDGVWDALSNKEVVDIVAAAPTRASAARMVVDCAVQEWRVRFPTSKIDDCAVVCLFLDQPSLLGQSQWAINSQRMPEVRPEPITVGVTGQQLADAHDPHPLPDGYLPQGNVMAEMFPPVGIDEIETIEVIKDEKLHNVNHPVTNNSSTGEEEWTALDGVTRVNTLLNIPRFKLGDARLTTQKS